jgi:hypothetical protein
MEVNLLKIVFGALVSSYVNIIISDVGCSYGIAGIFKEMAKNVPISPVCM